MPPFTYGGHYMKRFKLDYQSPIGMIEIEGNTEAIEGINFAEREELMLFHVIELLALMDL